MFGGRGTTLHSPLGGPALAAGGSRSFPVAGACGVPATARAVAFNVTVTGATAAGNLALFPGDAPPPLASTLNYAVGQTRANNAVVAVGAAGDIIVRCVQPGGGTAHVVLDVTGYFE